MSKRTYVDSPHDATKGWTVEQDEKDGLYYVMVPDDVMCDCGCPNCRTVIEKKMRRHTAKWNTGRQLISLSPQDTTAALERRRLNPRERSSRG